MVDGSLIIGSVLFVVTVGAAIEYYRRLRKVHKEYEKARDAVDDIILSVNRQLRQETEKLTHVAYKVEACSSKSQEALSKAEKVEKQLNTVESKASTALKNTEEITAKLSEVDAKVRDAVTSQETLVAKISEIREQAQRFSAVPQAKVEAVIPIKREKAIAPLTQTEVSVLEMLVSEGSKTAPEIKNRITLSREHTARLMKKLYEEGYLERETSKIPFKYSVKKEMEKLLKKMESETTQHLKE